MNEERKAIKNEWRKESYTKMNEEREAVKNEWRKGSYKKWMKKGKL